jgi:hypothetical protein
MQEIPHAFYHAELKKLILLLGKWHPILSVTGRLGHQAHENQMGEVQHRTPAHLAEPGTREKSVQFLEYILVHELTHLVERHHNERSTGFRDQHLPQCRALRGELNGSVLRSFRCVQRRFAHQGCQ